ncbi:MAG TPA: 2,3-diphosphoglycerate synthetase [Actinomycetota bacterium]|nr:2,3-diphosphoglycerate synthetase [Actinomycetota bacterium]
MRVLVLVDGEHYPPVTRWGIEEAARSGYRAVAALLVGGTEKLRPGEAAELGVPVRVASSDRAASLARAIDELGPEGLDGVLDLSDEPVLGYRERMELAAVTLVRGLFYVGGDFRLDPPIEGPPLPVATLAVIGTGKRTGKTAIGGEVARVAAADGRNPVVVAMGRGGPPEPQVARAGSVTLERLLELVRRGEHAASDYLEDAVTSGVTTVGARRAGGGLAGRPIATNVRQAADVAVGLGAGLVVLEGSGASVPPVPWDAGILVVPATAPPEYVGGYLGPFRLLLSDLVVVTMARSPAGLENLPILRSHVQRLRGDAQLIVTDFEPQPLGDVRGKDVFFTTTAPGAVAARQAETIQRAHGCRVVGWSARLADRAGLAEDMDGADEFDILLTELKAAAVDVACDRALARGAEVVFADNRAVVVEGAMDLPTALRETIELSRERKSHR